MTTRGRVIRTEWVVRADLRAHPDRVYVFGDNMRRVGLGGQAREMRGEPNAIGIPTKWAPSMSPSAFFSDKDWDNPVVRGAIQDAVWALHQALEEGRDVVIPSSGPGQGLSRLGEKAPRIAAWIDAELTDLCPNREIQRIGSPAQRR